MLDLLIVGLKFTRPACHAAAAAIDRHLLPAPDLSSKPADRRCCCCRPTGETDGRTDTRPFSDAYRIVCGPCIGKRRRRKSGLPWGRNFHPISTSYPYPWGSPYRRQTWRKWMVAAYQRTHSPWRLTHGRLLCAPYRAPCLTAGGRSH